MNWHNLYANCKLCPHKCGVNRTQKQRGFCGAGDMAEVYRYAPHFGEEPPISGSRGSGTVFFNRCTMKCIYCQNYPWSQNAEGEMLGVDGLIKAFEYLIEKGCHNINLVSPTPWLPDICEALCHFKRNSKKPLVVYNTSGFERVETIKMMEEFVDIFLPDLRYSEEASAYAFSKVKNYVANARNAILEMYKQKGALLFDENGIAQKGVICRILVLPELTEEAKALIKFLADEIGPDVGISLMSQYTPAYKAPNTPPLNRRLLKKEYDDVVDFLSNFNFNNVWIQEYVPASEDEFLGFKMKPSFDITNTK